MGPQLTGVSMQNDDLELLEEARAILNSQKQSNKLEDSELICECKCVTVGDIREFLKEKDKSLDLKQLQNELKLGSGCSSCAKSFHSWKDKI